MKNFVLFACASCLATVAVADSTWQCANSIAEISCAKQGNCQIPQNLNNTFRITIKNNNQIAVCAQNNCWRGSSQAIQNGNQTTYAIKQFSWTTLEQPNSEYLLAVDQNTQRLSLQGAGKKYNLQCVNA